jgi:hypothetical protein
MTVRARVKLGLSAPAIYLIPPATKPARCKYCGIVVYWVRTPSGAKMPLSVDKPGCKAPGRFKRTGTIKSGLGLNHMTECVPRKLNAAIEPLPGGTACAR